MSNAQRRAAAIGNPSYAIDDQTTVQVTDDGVRVISEGNWKYFGPDVTAPRTH